MKAKYAAMLRRAKLKNLPVDLSLSDFRDIKLGDCDYCGVSELLLKFYCKVMSINTPWMSIDRKNNELGYSKENCVSSCYLCNKIKGSFFTYTEMKDIGEKYVRPKMIYFEKEAHESFKEWCEDNIFFDDELEEWGRPSEF